MRTSLPRSSVICAPVPVTSTALELDDCAVTKPPSPSVRVASLPAMKMAVELPDEERTSPDTLMVALSPSTRTGLLMPELVVMVAPLLMFRVEPMPRSTIALLLELPVVTRPPSLTVTKLLAPTLMESLMPPPVRTVPFTTTMPSSPVRIAPLLPPLVVTWPPTVIMAPSPTSIPGALSPDVLTGRLEPDATSMVAPSPSRMPARPVTEMPPDGATMLTVTSSASPLTIPSLSRLLSQLMVWPDMGLLASVIVMELSEPESPEVMPESIEPSTVHAACASKGAALSPIARVRMDADVARRINVMMSLFGMGNLPWASLWS